MKKQTRKQEQSTHLANRSRVRYEAPAIIFEGRITTRAGSQLDNPEGVDPTDLFGS